MQRLLPGLAQIDPGADDDVLAVDARRLGGPRQGRQPAAHLGAEVVDDGVTGALVRPGDPVALGAAVAGLLADPALRRRQGTAGRRRYEARFTRARMAADTAAVYESVLAAAEVAA